MNIIKWKLNILKKREIDKKIDNPFSWIKGAELVELKLFNTIEDPDRPELTRNFYLNNGTIKLQINQDTQNFEYKI